MRYFSSVNDRRYFQEADAVAQGRYQVSIILHYTFVLTKDGGENFLHQAPGKSNEHITEKRDVKCTLIWLL